MLDPMRKYAQSWGIKIVFGLIIIVFVFWGVGSFRGDKATMLATIDGQPVLIKDYEKQYQEALRLVKSKNPDVTDKDLQEGGFRWQVFSNLVTTRLLEAEAQKLGVSVSPDEMRVEIAKIPAFQDKDKKFDSKIYENLLRSNGVTPGEFESDLHQQLLLEKLAGYVGLPAMVTEAEARGIFDFMREQAVIHYIPFKAEDLAKGYAPTPEQIKAYYDARKDQFATPAQIKIDYVEFTPKALAQPEAVSEADIETAYKANQKKYAKPEQVRVRHFLIMLPPDAPKEAVDTATAKLKDIAAKLKAGAEFSSLLPKNPNNPEGLIGEDWAWLPKGSLPKEFAAFEAKAFSLKKDEISEPVRTSLGLHLIQTGDHQAAGEKSLDEVKDEIRGELAEQKAADQLSKALDAVQDKIASGEDLAKAAAAEKLEVKTSAFFNQQTPPPALGLSEPAVATLFKMKKGDVSDTPLSTQDGFLLARVADVQPAGFEPLEKVTDVIKDRLAADEGQKRARAKAEETAKSMETPEGQQKVLAEYKDKIAASQPFSRQGFIPGLGMSPVLVQTAFEAKEPGWFKAAYAVSDGYVLAGLDKRIPADPAMWETEKGRWVQTLTQTKRTEMFNAYLNSVRDAAKVEIVNDQILGPKPVQGGAPATAGK